MNKIYLISLLILTSLIGCTSSEPLFKDQPEKMCKERKMVDNVVYYEIKPCSAIEEEQKECLSCSDLLYSVESDLDLCYESNILWSELQSDVCVKGLECYNACFVAICQEEGMDQLCLNCLNHSEGGKFKQDYQFCSQD